MRGLSSLRAGFPMLMPLLRPWVLASTPLPSHILSPLALEVRHFTSSVACVEALLGLHH